MTLTPKQVALPEHLAIKTVLPLPGMGGVVHAGVVGLSALDGFCAQV